ncbi:unnamed protein product [Symbiodinium sp. CCMP2592]|nr:unnamed protein product [Symbiodinium sp. CCMP2592]
MDGVSRSKCQVRPPDRRKALLMVSMPGMAFLVPGRTTRSIHVHRRLHRSRRGSCCGREEPKPQPEGPSGSQRGFDTLREGLEAWRAGPPQCGTVHCEPAGMLAARALKMSAPPRGHARSQCCASCLKRERSTLGFPPTFSATGSFPTFDDVDQDDAFDGDDNDAQMLSMTMMMTMVVVMMMMMMVLVLHDDDCDDDADADYHHHGVITFIVKSVLVLLLFVFRFLRSSPAFPRLWLLCSAAFLASRGRSSFRGLQYDVDGQAYVRSGGSFRRVPQYDDIPD